MYSKGVLLPAVSKFRTLFIRKISPLKSLPLFIHAYRELVYMLCLHSDVNCPHPFTCLSSCYFIYIKVCSYLWWVVQLITLASVDWGLACLSFSFMLSSLNTQAPISQLFSFNKWICHINCTFSSFLLGHINFFENFIKTIFSKIFPLRWSKIETSRE